MAFAHRVKAELEILTNVGVRDLGHATGTERGIAEERTEFEQGQAVFGENIQGISQQFIGARPEGFQMPPLPQDLGELGDLDEPAVSVAGFEGIDPDRHLGIVGLDDDEPVVKISLDSFFAIGNRAEQERRKVAVQIEEHEPTASFDILFGKGLQ